MNKATIIGRIDTETKRIMIAPTAVNRKAQPDDIVLSDGQFRRMVWNHNGQRLTSVVITDLVVSVWAKSELDADRLAAQIDADRIVATHGERIRQQISRAGYRQLSQRLTQVQRRQQWAVQ